MQYILVGVLFIALVLAAFGGLFSSNPYEAHDSLMFLLALSGAILAFAIVKRSEYSKKIGDWGLTGIATLVCIILGLVAIYWGLILVASGNVCQEHYGVTAARCK